MKKRWTAALTALALVLLLLPARGQAAASAGCAGSRLTGVDRAVYDALRTEILKIANGTRSSTSITIPDQPSLSWTLEELGAAGAGRREIVDKLREKVSRTVDIARVYTALTSDLPYEMFWRGLEYSYGYDSVVAGGRAAVRRYTVSIRPSPDYRGGGTYTVDASKVAAANKAAQNARAIVDEYRDRSDYEKLTAYREEICRLVSYDSQAARSENTYGDPWQLVSVFDGDPDTNVVCEGYAKAFQYLCDLSDFQGDIVCRTVTGTLDGPHMWNVVRMEDARNYLVDVTNCDAGTSGYPDKLFLAGGSGDGRSYTVSLGGRSLSYAYSSDQDGLFGDGYLALSPSRYVYQPGAAVQPASPFSDVPSRAYYIRPVVWAVNRGITVGTSSTTFTPGRVCTHSEILTFLWRSAGKPAPGDGDPIPGAEEDSFYYDAARWAAGRGMIDPDAFDPRAVCTRADAVRYIWLACGAPPAGRSGFTDVAADAPYARAVDWAAENGVTDGSGGAAFSPDLPCDRGQIVTFLYRAYH